MNTFFTFLFGLLSIFGLSQNTAMYKVTFNSEWSNSTHPHPTNNFPETAHWSRLIGTTHNSNYTLFTVGELASSGIKDVAERGVNTALFNEVDYQILNGNAYQRIRGPFLNNDLGQITINEIEVSKDFPLISLVSMIAPSPDWFIGIKDIPLLDNEQNWIEIIQLDLYPYDAGTDSGTDYESDNLISMPAELIANYTGVSPFSNLKMGTLTIELIDDGNLNTSDFFISEKTIKIYPNPVKNVLNISTDVGVHKIEMHSIEGKMVLNKYMSQEKDVELLLPNLASGVYFLKVELETGDFLSEKILVQ